jgi:class 3 adenylate cyclase
MNEEQSLKRTIPFHRRISIRVTIILLIILSLGIGITVLYYLRTQNSAIIVSREMAIREESEVLYRAVKSNMLAGEAPIAVELFRELSRTEFVADIKLYRADGVIAFSDNATLETVNRNIGKDRFAPKESFLPREVTADANFKMSVDTINDVFISDVSGRSKTLFAFKPLINQPRCSLCHGADHVIRGVIMISSPVDDLYRQTRANVLISLLLYGGAVLVLSLAIILFINRFVIRRVSVIGAVARRVGEGDFQTRIEKSGDDEIGELSREMNLMIEGLHERFKLSKFVSRSTLEHVRSADEVRLGGEKRRMAVLFSDIRGFTAFSEKRDPDEVMRVLNEVMNLQSDIIQDFGGDIDKYVGDEIMAVFEGEDMTLRAVKAAEKIRGTLSEKYSGDDEPVTVGIGINTGEMISGNMGSGRRMERTVIGDTVNVGARLCSIAGKNTIVLSEFSFDDVKDFVEAAEHEPVKVKGKLRPLKVFTLRRVL